MIRLEVLGNQAGFPGANGASTGYLVSAGGTTLLVDCGMGIFPRLRAAQPALDLDAVLISHLHGDHIHDLLPLAWALAFAPVVMARRTGRPPEPVKPIPLYLPPGGRALLEAWDALFPMSPAPPLDRTLRTAFTAVEYDTERTVEVGAFSVRWFPMRHAVPSYGMRLTAGQTTLAFSADTEPTPSLLDLARDADAFLCEATTREPHAHGHLSGGEAGEHARRAGARRLLLTHLINAFDRDSDYFAALRDDAAATFGGPVDLTWPGESYEIRRHPVTRAP